MSDIDLVYIGNWTVNNNCNIKFFNVKVFVLFSPLNQAFCINKRKKNNDKQNILLTKLELRRNHFNLYIVVVGFSENILCHCKLDIYLIVVIIYFVYS